MSRDGLRPIGEDTAMLLQLPGYRVTGTIYESANTCVVRGVHEGSGENVIVKVPNSEHPSRGQLARWRYEYAMLEGRHLPGVIRCYSLENDRGRPALVLEDIGGTSLRQAISGALSARDFLQIAIPLAEALGAVHEAGIVHKDVNPSNVVVDLTTGALRLIDFGIASRLPRESQEARHPSQLEGTLLYLSPEQTGRMNRSVDYRTDFYSLGMTFYELLAGHPAFTASDPLELVYSHIARAPLSLRDVDPSIPLPLSDIVAKLLAKTAEDRYQSAFGLVHDLRECDRRLRAEGTISAFSIGRRDVSRSLQLPQQLFGREHEIAALLAAFERAGGAGARAETVLVTGYSGIGKSSVVREVHKSIAQRRGYFASGKADPYKRDVPYDVLAQALGQLLRQVLLEQEAEVTSWAGRLGSALGADAPLLSSVLPEIERILGSQPTPPELAPAESRARLEGAFCALLGAFSSSGRPVVLFLDDLQWVDAASLQILAAIVLRTDIRGVLIVGAYRDNEVNATHPLALAEAAIEKVRPGATRTLTLRPLSTVDVRQYVADALHLAPRDVVPLADLLHEKTGGNPFFLNQLLSKLEGDRLVRFQPETGSWGWDLAAIAEAPITDNVVDLMVDRIARLSEPARRAIQVAACVGNRFDLAALAAVSGRPVRETAAALWEPLREGLIVPASDRYRAPEIYADDDAAPTETRVVAYRFLHDRVHQAAYSMVGDAERLDVHAALGRKMMRALSDGVNDATLFDVVGHLMAGGSRIEDPSDRLAVARCALLAGRRARSSLAYDAAVSFLRFGIGLLPVDAWIRDYRLTFELHTEALHGEYLAGHSERADALFQTVLRFAGSHVEKAEAYRARIVLLENASQFEDALRCGAECLRLFGLELDLKPSEAAVMALVGEVKGLLGARVIGSLLEAPEAKDPETLALAQTLLALTAPAYFLGPTLFASLVAHMVLLALRRGNTPFSAAGYVFFGVVLASFGDHETGYDFGRLALDLSQRYPNPAIRGKVEFMFGNWLNFRRHHARTDVDHLVTAFQSCVAVGDRTYATYCCIGLVQLFFALGKNVAEAHAEVGKWMGFVEQVKAADIADNIRTIDRAFLCLAGQTHGADTYDDDAFVEADFERHLNEVRSPPAQAYFYHHRSLVRFIAEHFTGALADTRESEKRQAATSGQLLAEEHPFHQSLILAATYSEVSDSERAEHIALLERNVARLRAISAHAPANFAHKVALVEAERARIQGDGPAAIEGYDRAVDLAVENGYFHHAAIANECAARYYLGRNRTTLARAYLTEAYHGYVAWGALAKVRLLTEKHRRLISDLVVDVHGSGLSDLTTTGTTLRGTYALDLLSVAKASQTISREIQLDRLLEQLVRILLENAGAERGFVLLRRGRAGDWVIEAAGDPHGVQVLRSIPIEAGVLPQTMIHYVARTGEAIVLDDAAVHDVYSRDPYIAREQVKSAACLPAMNTGNLVAIVYLENNLSTAAFSVDRLEVLRLLSTQIAISIDNATLYAGLEEKVRDRTAALERAQSHLRLLERLETERQIAGGFAHELRNSLAGPAALIAEALGLNGARPPSSTPHANAKRLEEVLALFAPTASAAQLAQLKSILRDVLAGEERLESMLQVVHGSVSRALWITKEILDYARVGNERAEPVLVDVNAIVRALARELELDLGRQRVRLEARLDPRVALVRAHEAQIHSVIKNLVLNARDATLAARAGSAEERTIVVTTEGTDAQARLAVVDRGIGIPPDDLGRVFEPFFSTKPESGTGLGLAVAKKIVSLAGGRLTVESKPGEGTRFDVVLPAAVASGATANG